MKKLVAIILVLTLVFCMSACSAKKISMGKVCSEFSKVGYEIEEDEAGYYTAEDFDISPRGLVNISSCEIWRELNSGAAEWGEIILLDFESADIAAQAYKSIMAEEDDYYEVDFEITESRNSSRVIADEYEYCEFFILSRVGTSVIYIYFDYEDFEDADVPYDYLPLKVVDKLGI